MTRWSEDEIAIYLARLKPATPARVAVPAPQSEKVFMAQVIKVATMLGWRHYHTFNSRRSAKGFPDLVLVHPQKGRIMFVEVKTETGKVTDEQMQWMDDLRRAKQTAFILRPSGFASFWKELKSNRRLTRNRVEPRVRR